MKLKITLFIIISVTACALAGALLAGPEPVTVTPTPNATPGWLNAAESLGQTIFAAKAASLAIYPSYDPYISVGGVKHPYGFGAALLYPVSEYAFAGVRVDFLGNTFWAPSAVVGAKYTLKNVPGQPTVFTIAGLIMPLGGAGDQNHVVGAITGLGATACLWHNKDGNFSVNAFAEGEKWTNFDGAVLHVGVAGGYKF